MEMIDLLQVCEERKASDLILTVGLPPVLRIDKKIIVTNMAELLPTEIERIILSILSKDQAESLRLKKELNFTYSVPGLARFRSCIFYQRNSLATVFRRIPYEIPTIEALRLPIEPLKRISLLKSGLVIVSGPVGSGKSTTLASLIEMINSEQACHIITIEDPVEYLFKHKKSIIEQREVYSDTESFATALKNVMRQNPDIILIGEMRDLETVQAAITAAETGVLVFTTLHTPGAAETINRIVDFFPASHQRQIMAQLSSVLQGVISQRLVPALSKKGLVAICEILLCLPSVRTMIREGSVHQIQNIIETSSKQGMQSMDQVLLSLYNQKIIAKEELLLYIKDREREEVKDILSIKEEEGF